MKNKRYPLARILGVIWGILLVCYITLAVSLFAQDEEYYTKPEHIVSHLNSEEYGHLYFQVINNLERGPRPQHDEEYAEVNAIADYIEAAFLLKAYTENGDEEMMDTCEKRIVYARSRIDRLSFCLEKIDNLLK